MKKLAYCAVLATSFALAACSAEEPADDAVAEETAAPEPVAVTVADGGPPEGVYEITTAEGNVFTETVNADGTYSDTDAEGNVVETGTWSVDGPNRWCSTPEGEEQKCYTETVDEAGVWTSVDDANPEGVSTVVRKS